jgi:hypothetical protein
MSGIKIATYNKYYAMGQRAAIAKLANHNLPEPSFSTETANSDPAARNSASLTSPNRNTDFMPTGALTNDKMRSNPRLSDSQMLEVVRGGKYTDPLNGSQHYIPGQEPVTVPRSTSSSSSPMQLYPGPIPLPEQRSSSSPMQLYPGPIPLPRRAGY